MKENYITAVLESLREGKDITSVLSGLKETLSMRGHQSLYATVLRGVARVLDAKGAVNTQIIVADKEALVEHKIAIASALEALGSTGDCTTVIDPSIIGGFIAEANHKQLDKSYKTKLVTLYRSLTK